MGKLKTLPRGALVLEDDGTIREVLSRAPERPEGRPVCDFGDSLILPSFADLHLHAPQYPMLGMGMDLPLLDWLKTYTFRTEARFADRDYARRVYRSLARELIANGTTRVAMFSSLHTEATWILMEELERAGVTGFVGKVNMDRDSGDELRETTEESERETLRWLDGCSAFSRVRPILTPRFTPSCTDELMAWLGRLAEERGLPVAVPSEREQPPRSRCAAPHPDCAQYWENLREIRPVKDRTLKAHCVYSDGRERAAMRESGVWAVHCADSNFNICSGVAPVRKLLDDGVQVALGSDIAGGAQLAMSQVIAMSIRASKVKRIEENWETDFLTVAEGYYLGSAAGARYFGAKGGFAPGDRLHAIVVNDGSLPEPVRPLSLTERFERAIYGMTKENITAVWSEGKRVK